MARAITGKVSTNVKPGFLMCASGAGSFIQRPIVLSISPIVQTYSVSPASIAGGNPKRAVNLHEIVIREIQRERRAVVLPLLAESVGQSGEVANLHSAWSGSGVRRERCKSYRDRAGR